MITRVFLILFSLVCVPCHGFMVPWWPMGGSAEPPETSKISTIPSVTKSASSSTPFSEEAAFNEDIAELDSFFGGSSSSDPSDGVNANINNISNFNDSDIVMESGKSSSETPQNNRRTITTVSSSSTTQEPATKTKTSTTITKAAREVETETSTKLQSTTSKTNKRNCEGPDCDDYIASEIPEYLDEKIVSYRVATESLLTSNERSNESRVERAKTLEDDYTDKTSYLLILLNFVGKLIVSGYPCYCTFRALAHHQIRHYSRWLMYWLFYACITVIECMTDLFLFSFQLYHTCKITFLVWCFLPMKYNGSSVLFKILVKCFDRKDEEAQENSSNHQEMQKSQSSFVKKASGEEIEIPLGE
ncbi:uncharacterized protein LOC141856833 [Brevipalpus obovatus]|uniref:uncharacterized protein LOC141856833 n=1 Tax=Brevipalpus obovatus TaxID=246614 RepID=UPI003D9F586E